MAKTFEQYGTKSLGDFLENNNKECHKAGNLVNRIGFIHLQTEASFRAASQSHPPQAGQDRGRDESTLCCWPGDHFPVLFSVKDPDFPKG